VVRAKRRDGASSPTLHRFVLQELVHVETSSRLMQPKSTSTNEQPLVMRETPFIVTFVISQNLQLSTIVIPLSGSSMVEFPESSLSLGGLKSAPQSLVTFSTHE